MSQSVPLYCPKCRKPFKQPATSKPNLKSPLVCPSCKARVFASELKTRAGKTIAETSADMIRDALKGVKGFKTKN